MPTLAAGSPSPVPCRVSRLHRGFTLLELLVVLAIVAFVSAAVGFALRDTVQTRLEREGLRLAALLEAGRMRSQVGGVAVRWRPLAQGFRFEGLPVAVQADDALPQGWLDADTDARVTTLPTIGTVPAAVPPPAAGSLVLGPEPIIAAQSVTLYSRVQPDKQIRLGTDGIRPFALQLDAVP